MGTAGAAVLRRGERRRQSGAGIPGYGEGVVPDRPLRPRAGLVADPARYRWSSAPARLGDPDASTILDQLLWQTCYDQDVRRAILTARSRDEALEKGIRDSTRTGRPLGYESFFARLESPHPHIRPNNRGPKPKPATRTATAQGVK